MCRYFIRLPNPGEKGEPKILRSDDDAVIARFTEAGNRPGWGVYYAPNPLKPGARRHGKDSIAAIAKFFFDIDLAAWKRTKG
jgi:hypothetical protein